MTPPSIPLDAIRQPAVLYDAGGRIIAANDLAEALADRELAGLSAAEVAAIFDVRSPDGTPIPPEQLAAPEALAGEESLDVPIAVTLPHGRRIEILATASPVRDGDAVTGALVVWHDVTARLEAEAALRESEERFQALLGASPDVTMLLDPDGTILAINETAARAFGGSATEFVGACIWEVMPAEVVDFRRERFNQALRSGRPSRYEEARNGRWYDTVVEPVFSGTGEVSRIAVISRDITERRLAVEALEESRARYQALIETNVDFVWEMDARGQYTYCSPQMERLWGIRPEEMLGRTPFDLLPPAERERALAAFAERASAPGGFSALELSSHDGRGEVVDLEISGVPFFSEDGTLLGFRGITRDVTTRKRAEEALRASEERLRLAQEGAGIGTWDRDAATDRVSVAPGFFRRFMLEGESMETYPDWGRLIHPDDRERVEIGRQAALAAGEPMDLEFRVVLSSGEVRWIQLMAKGVADGHGTLVRVLGVLIDVTDRKRAEEALTESEERYRELVEQAGSIILRFDLSGRITFVNEFAQRFFGYTVEELLGRNAVGTIIPEIESSTGRDMAEMVREIVRSPERFTENENENIRKDGDRVWVRWANRPIVSPDGIVREFIAIGTDITDRKRAEEALIESEADARSFFMNMVDACAVCELVVNDRGEPVDIRLVEVNPAFERELSLPAHLIVGQTAFMILPTLHREWLDLFLEVSRQQTFIQVEDPFPALDRWYHVTGFPVRNGRVAVVFRDITGQRGN